MNVVKKLMFGIICVTLTSVSFAAPVLHCTEQTVSVTVSPGDVSSRCGVILCWGDEVGGGTVDSWENAYVLTTNSLSSEGGTWTVDKPPVDGCRAKWINNEDGTSTLYLCRTVIA